MQRGKNVWEMNETTIWRDVDDNNYIDDMINCFIALSPSCTLLSSCLRLRLVPIVPLQKLVTGIYLQHRTINTFFRQL